MDKDTQENPKKEERRARRLARELLISYVVQNPGAIRIIKENKKIFDPASDLSVSDFAKFILDKMNEIWKYGKLYLFSFVGMAINPSLVGEYIFIGILILSISLTIRSIGVLIALVGTNLTFKERMRL